MAEQNEKPLNFLEEIISADLESGKHTSIRTRFPPEPNGYLHIGHAKSICLNFGLAKRFGGVCNLRMDDTNPEKEDVEYVESIKEDVTWLGGEWDGEVRYASEYFDQLYSFAQKLIRDGKAYVCSLSEEELREHRGTVNIPGRPSPDRDRPVEESLDLMERMKNGEFAEGTYTVRAKIDMAHVNMKMRDPLIYRIKRQPHHHVGAGWNIYPMYDFAHGLSDAIEHITHSICTLEFDNNRILYDWFVEAVDPDGLATAGTQPRQYEFARLNLAYTVMSKRKLKQLVEEKHVEGWDDPRMPTISGLRRRGYTPESIRDFSDRIGVARRDNVIDVGLLEFCLRDHLNKIALRRMAVLNPVELVIENWPEGRVEMVSVPNNPEDPEAGSRKVPFSGHLFIERDDFMIDPPKKFFRLSVDREVRLRSAYYVKATRYEADSRGEVTRIYATYDPESAGGNALDGRKVKATLHWVSVPHAVDVEVRLYDRLFSKENPEEVQEGESFLDNLNKDSLKIIPHAKAEPALLELPPGEKVQFERIGYFSVDPLLSKPQKPVFNRAVTLRDDWAKVQAKG